MNKKIKILLGIFLFLFILVLIFENPFKKDFKAEHPLFFPHLNSDAIEKIQIENFTNGILIFRKNNEWKVKPFQTELAKVATPGEKYDEAFQLADDVKVKRLINTFKKIEKDVLITNNINRHTDFEIVEHSFNIAFKDKNDKILAHLFIGKAANTMLACYVKEAGSTKIYRVKENLKASFDFAIDEWKQKESQGEPLSPPGK